MGISNFYRGDTVTYLLEVKDDNGAPLDITGATVWCTLKVADDLDSNAALQVTQSTHTDAVNGKTTVTLPATSTDLLEVRTYLYDFQLVTADNRVFTFLSGEVDVLMDITRSVA